MPDRFQITAHRVDVINGFVAPATIEVVDGTIHEIKSAPSHQVSQYVIPGFVDAHIHIESSMLLPSRFAQAAVVHGTVAAVCDPHEIANVCGIEGVNLMLRDAMRTDFKFCFGAPSCVPTTTFETAGAELNLQAVTKLLDDNRIGYLAEMMNFPGVLARDAGVMAKISAAHDRGKRVDGHAPGLRGHQAIQYINAGITTDHECTTIDEAIEKMNAGCKIAIREGSAARNFDALVSLIDRNPDQCMLCSDDKHPDELLLGHINQLAARAVAAGCDPLNVLRVACKTPVQHYDLPVGLLQEGDPADFTIVSDLTDFQVLETYVNGRCVAKNGVSLMKDTPAETINRFAANSIDEPSIAIPAEGQRVRVIRVEDGQLLTSAETVAAKIVDGHVVGDTDRDILKLLVLNRYQPVKKPAVGLVRGFGLKSGAMASTVAHDSHNIVAVGENDADLCRAVNSVVNKQGGLSVAFDGQVDTLPLPIAGLMNTGTCAEVAHAYTQLDRRVKDLGCQLKAPYMTLSFLALLVIPSLKLSDKGLFDVEQFEFVSLFA